MDPLSWVYLVNLPLFCRENVKPNFAVTLKIFAMVSHHAIHVVLLHNIFSSHYGMVCSMLDLAYWGQMATNIIKYKIAQPQLSRVTYCYHWIMLWIFQNVQRIPAALPSTPKQKMFQSPKVIKNKLSVVSHHHIAVLYILANYQHDRYITHGRPQQNFPANKVWSDHSCCDTDLFFSSISRSGALT